MLHISKKTKLATLAAVCLVFLAGGLRVVDIGDWSAIDAPLGCLGSMIYVGLLLGWGISLGQRLTDERVKRLLLTSVSLMVFWFVLRCAKYDFFDGYSSVLRYLWYAYYIPMNLLPTLAFLAARAIGLRPGRSLCREGVLLLIPDLLFTLLVFTNDLHQLVFGFPFGIENWDVEYTQLPLFFVLYAWMAVQYVGALGIIFYKCRISKSRRQVWLPIIWMFGAGAFFFWYNATQFVRYRVFQMTEMTAILFAAVWESLIQTGLVPSNIGYWDFFAASTVNAQIVDRDGQVRFLSKGAASITAEQRQLATDRPLLLDPDTRLQSCAIRAGRVFWKDDLSAIHRLNRELEEDREALAEENDLIRTENEIKEERARLQEQNRLYNRMAELVRPQLEKIQKLTGALTPGAADFSRRLGTACVLAAYVKRRSNLLLISEKEALVDVAELGLCIQESLDYLVALGIPCDFRQYGTGQVDPETICRVYDGFEAAVEAALPGLNSLLARLSVEHGVWTLRLVMDGPEALPGGVEQDGTLYLTFSMEKGEEK